MNKNNLAKYDVGIVGGGIAGLTAAFQALNNGLSVVIFEKKQFGGLSLNGGNVLFTKMFKYINQGIISKNNPIKDLQEIYDLAAKQKVFYLQKYLTMFNKTKQVEVVQAKGEIINKNTLKANDKLYEVENLILAYGAKPYIPKIEGFADLIGKEKIVFSDELLKIKTPPKKLLVYGGGRIAFEVAMFYSNLNTDVNIIARGEVLRHLDEDTKEAFFEAIKNDNLNIIENADITKFTETEVKYYKNNKLNSIDFDVLVVATGFTPNYEVIKNLEIEKDNEGIIVSKNLKTSVDNVYAIGDCNNNERYSALATKEAMAAVNDIMGINIDYFENDFTKHVLGVYQYAYLGTNEMELKEKNIPYIKKTIHDFELPNNEEIKFIKVMFHKETRKLLGVYVISKDASNHLQAIISAINETIAYENLNIYSPFTQTSYIAEIIREFLDEYDLKIINENYKPYYQPKVDDDKNIIGAESLARFFFNDKIVNPLFLIEAFEKSGLIINFDLKVIKSAYKLLIKLEQENLLKNDFKISCNVSPFTIAVLPPEELIKIIDNNENVKNHLILEVTERPIINSKNFIKNLNRYIGKGFKISLDDFSIGHSSVNLFKEIDFKEVKIDMAILPTEEDITNMQIYKNIVLLLQTKNNDIIAEGVETEFQHNYLKQFNLKGYQGYYFYRPMSVDDFLETIKKEKLF